MKQNDENLSELNLKYSDTPTHKKKPSTWVQKQWLNGFQFFLVDVKII